MKWPKLIDGPCGATCFAVLALFAHRFLADGVDEAQWRRVGVKT